MYEGDSFFTLSASGQAGLLALSVGFAVLAVAVVWRLARGRGVVLRLGVWAALFAAFVWLSPQGYYTYYRMIFDGLPAQWVIGAPPSPLELAAVLSFTGPATLSAHSTGGLGWLMLGAALVRGRKTGGTDAGA